MQINPEIDYVTVNSYRTGQRYTMQIIYKNEPLKCENIEDHDSLKKFILEHGKFFKKNIFKYFNDKFPDLTAPIKVEWSKRRNAIKSYNKNVHSQIKSVELGPACLHSAICQHNVILTLHNGEKVEYHLNAQKIAKKYTPYLDIFSIMHIKKYISDEHENDILNKINAISEGLETVQVSLLQWQVFMSGVWKPTLRIDCLNLKYKNNTIIKLECRDPKDIVKYFAKFLDEESKNYPGIKSLLIPAE